MLQNYFVYMMASKRNGTLYIGVTHNLIKRVDEHKQGIGSSFCAKYNINKLVWFEATANYEAAIVREKQIKNWNRAWKLRLIEVMNPDWDDLYRKIL